MEISLAFLRRNFVSGLFIYCYWHGLCRELLDINILH